jgi:hypothetical protein
MKLEAFLKKFKQRKKQLSGAINLRKQDTA